ncbi:MULTISPECIES: hypothetical protein [pseudomallei group]|uniref:hypothetical protein n=1 Tax=pseudomallei group TaxID=111527 RepID=UPI0005B72A0D|nr:MULTISPECIES: hypothetical protein [pseudomallei group]AVR10995.1 hypothetical protein A8H31_28065 [Burkholderia thailandensis]KIS58553.1 hypothetical protein BTP_5440 [Burkholderia thailandensis Phuket 4W-1]MBF4044442.1 hypothetical protein [Burkholderia pseudomallei]MCV9914836.1 hypothetical protein [Burkholderia pseudomallei]MCW0071103.1 hypothetical protein [Burkholderia pseudomallei]
MLDNLKLLHDAVVKGLREALPTIERIEAYPEIGAQIQTPMIAVELSEMEPGHDDGTGSISLIARMQARIIVDPYGAEHELHVREIAARLALGVHMQTWGLPIAPGRVVQVGEDPFRPQLDTYLVWLVEWTHEFGIGGELDEIPDGRTIVWGVDPSTGPDNESSYWDPAQDTSTNYPE